MNRSRHQVHLLDISEFENESRQSSRRGLPACAIQAMVAAMMAIVSGAPLTAQSPQPDPFPPRVFSMGYASSSAHTLAKGTGHLSASYAGSDLLAQLGIEGGSSLPFIVGAAYGVTDRFTVGVGTGIWRYDVDLGFDLSASGTDLFPYVAPKFSLWDSGEVTISISGRVVVPTGEDSEGFLYGTSLGLSAYTGRQSALHISAGIWGARSEFYNERDVVFAIGGDYAAPIESNYLKLFGELRMIMVDDGAEVIAAGVRFLGNTLGAEAGLAHWLEEESEIKPIVSVSYRF